MIAFLKRAFARPGRTPPLPLRSAPIRSIPRANTVLVVDCSYSMAGPILAPNGAAIRKLEAAREAAVLLARHKAVNAPQDLLACVGFGTEAFLVFPLTHPVHPSIQQKITKLEIAGTTNLQAGLRQAMNLLRQRPGNFLRQIVILTDGQPNVRSGLDELVAEARAARITIHAIGVGSTSSDLDVPLLQRIAAGTVGGKYQHVRSLAELTRALRAAA